MNWSRNKSLCLSRVCVAVFAVLLAALAAGAPWLWPRLLRRGDASLVPLYVAVTWFSAVPAAVVLWRLHLLLASIGRGDVFCAQNARSLRIISWCCIAAGLVYLAGGAWDVYLFILAAAAGFVGLILRVLKNVFEEAVRIKEENDYTI